MLYTSSGVWLAASTRGDGWLPISPASRDTRPPSSSTLTASGSGPADAAMSASDPSESIDRSVQLPMKMPPTWWLSTTARASAAPVTPTISSCASLSRVDMPASSASPSPHAGAAGPAAGAAAPAVAAIVGDGRRSAGRRVVRRRASRPAGTRPSPSVPAGLCDWAMGLDTSGSGSLVLFRGRQARSAHR